MSSHRLPDDFNRFLATSSNVISDPGSGGTFDLQPCPMFGFATIASGTRVLPDNMPAGTKFFVYATGSVTINTAAAVTMASLTSGQIGEFTARTATTWNVIIHSTTGALSLNQVTQTLTTSYGYVPIPLTAWREVTSNDISDAGVGAADSSGGVLATDTTPALEYINGDTNSSLRLFWTNTADNRDPVVCQVVLPADLDETQPIYFKAVGVMSGVTNAPVLDLDTYFTELTGGGMTKVEDATGALSDAVGVVSATIAASDFASLVNNNTPLFATIELTPGTHSTDSIAIYGTYLQYTKTLLTA
jgi:hypothetical protein